MPEIADLEDTYTAKYHFVTVLQNTPYIFLLTKETEVPFYFSALRIDYASIYVVHQNYITIKQEKKEEALYLVTERIMYSSNQPLQGMTSVLSRVNLYINYLK